ncbi:MAG TPA: FtsX-like permease family protein, partial [Blastocatellia bacterium]|nr:FtsX-like permease family protein [Blastocatellia bacterium]
KLMEVVGVTADLKQFSLEAENKPAFFVPFRQKDSLMTLIVRSSLDPAALVPALRARIQAVDSRTAVTRVRTFDELVSASVAQPRFYALLLGLFAGIALTLAVIGIYGVMAYTVSRRTHEIGIRLALGAEAGRILRMVIGQGLTLILIGVAGGLAGAWFLTKLMADLLFGVTPTDPAVFVLISLTLIAAALTACLLPARRAARIDPLAALRHE